MRKIIKDKKTLFYNDVEDDYYRFVICKEFGGVEKYKFQRFDKLKKNLTTESFEKVCRSIKDIKEDNILFTRYVIKGGLPLYYHLNSKYLIVISSGEIQRFVYKIYLEGVWELEEGDLLNEKI
jgi:hypothetical protein